MASSVSSRKLKSAAIVAVLAILLAGVIGYRLGTSEGEKAASTMGGASPGAAEHLSHGVSMAESDEGETIWTCSMHPQIRLPHPGKCPICSMDLIPLEPEEERGAKEGKGSSLRELTLSPQARKLAEIETAPVERQTVDREVIMVGKAAYDETRVREVTARFPGRLDRLYVDFTGTRVKRGEALVSIYSPELYAAQSELLQAVRVQRELKNTSVRSIRETADATAEAAREKLRLWGLSDGQIQGILKHGKPTDHVTLYSPMSGVVVQKRAQEGSYVSTGTPIYTVADLSRVWVELAAYETDLPWIRLGQDVRFETEAWPGEWFHGEVAFIDPILNPKTRTVKVRLNASNEDGRLKPEMFVRAKLEAALQAGGRPSASPAGSYEPTPLTIPASAPLITGKRAVVYVADPERPGRYVGREVVLGPRAGGRFVVLAGVREGEEVVVRGNFKLDSALQIRAKPSMMSPEGAVATGAHAHHGGGGRAEMEPMAAGTMEMLPAAFTEEVRAFLESFTALEGQFRSEDLERIRDAYARLGRLLGGLNPSPLEGEDWMLWAELAMRIKNVTVMGEEVEERSEAMDLYVDLQRLMERVKGRFGPPPPAPKPRRMQAPEEFREQLAQLVRDYLEVQQALSTDEFARAKRGLKALEDDSAKVNMGLLRGDAHEAWMKILTTLKEAAGIMHQAEDLDGLRKCFALFSEAMIQVMDLFSPSLEQPVRLAHCPMAFDSRGAYWLQSAEEIQNPYYGSMMFGCGEIRKSYDTGGDAATEGSGDHVR